MKFDFENHIPKVEKEEIVEDPLTELEKQQKFEEECINEANKLNISLIGLKNDIDAFGGEEKFKEIYEGSSRWNNRKEGVTENLAGETQRELDKESKIDKGIAIGLPTTMLGIATVMNLLDMNHPNHLGYENIVDSIQALKMGVADVGNYLQVIVAAVTAFGVTFSGKFALDEVFRSRKAKREKEINDLKFKMTDTQVIRVD